ncbi:MAG: diaminopimelate epimerase [Flavobacteriales bacterium]
MARIRFTKWQGTGNDFIVVDDHAGAFPVHDRELVTRLCDRHFGIGSDGLILVQAPKHAGHAFHMDFLNPDGSRSFCGNGSRCAAAFQAELSGLPEARFHFTAVDGEHTAAVAGGQVTIGMRDVAQVKRINDTMDFIHTGSPHLVIWVPDPEQVDILPEARFHRYNEHFRQEGVNVNFVRWHNERVEMRTYERGVEDETLSCGTGVTAAALSVMVRGLAGARCAVHTRGGDLAVGATRIPDAGFTAITLAGPARKVFEGTVESERP